MQTPHPRRLIALLLGLTVLTIAGAAARTPALPALVFVSRNPVAGSPGLVPGLGPDARAASPGGRLLVREAGGRIRPLLAPARFFDVSDPAVSWDGRRVAFAAVEAAGGRWRLWTVGADGRDLRPVTGGPGDFDDLDPCWLPDGRLVFASTRLAMRAQEGALPVTNLWEVGADGAGLVRVTTERNGAEEPAIDPRTGRIVYARWWTNRWLASERDPLGVTLDRARAVPADTVDLWQAVSILPDGEQLKLAGGDPRSRATTVAYQPALLADGTLVGVGGRTLSLRGAARPFLQSFAGGFAEARRLGGGDTAACAPAALPDGRIVLSLDPAGRGDYGLWVARADGRGLAKLLDLPGTLELDAAPLAARPRPPVLAGSRGAPPEARAVADAGRLRDDVNTFRFDCLNVFANAPLDQPFPDAVPLQRGVRIRFYATLARSGAAGGDSVVLLREAAVLPWGGVHEDGLPADVPMFEQLVDAEGRVLRSAMGPAHVAGSNFAPFGTGTKCVGCHVGHSAIPVPNTYSDARWIDASPSAEITASSTAAECRGPAAVADRRTRGNPGEVGWIAAGNQGEFLRLRWRWPIEVRELVLYALSPSPAQGTDLRVLEAEVVLSRGGRVVERSLVRGPWSPRGTRVACSGAALDAAEIRFTKTSGGIAHRPAVGLLEVETIARLVED